MKTISRRHWVRKLLSPTSGLRYYVFSASAGFLIFVFGAALSFRVALKPILAAMSSGMQHMVSAVVPASAVDVAMHLIGGATLFLGLYFLYYGVRGTMRTLMGSVGPGQKHGIMDVYLRRQLLANGPKIVAIGGGTGLSTLLRGLKHHSSNITAIVTVTDDGGSSGRLSQEKGMIPPGDIRNCLVALADAEKLMTDLFQHRFKIDSGSLSGHSLGNLLIAALVDQSNGDFDKALTIASDVLNIRGRVLPSTLDHVRLRAKLDDGTEICGETKIVAARKRIQAIFLDPEEVSPYPAALEAIANADLICIGPGSVFTSIIPNLLVPGIAEAIADSQAVKAYVCNVMTQPGESENFSASEHVSVILGSVAHKVFDFALINNGSPSEGLRERYKTVGQHLVDADIDLVRAQGFRVVAGDFMSETDMVRHDPMRVASRLVTLINR